MAGAFRSVTPTWQATHLRQVKRDCHLLEALPVPHPIYVKRNALLYWGRLALCVYGNYAFATSRSCSRAVPTTLNVYLTCGPNAT